MKRTPLRRKSWLRLRPGVARTTRETPKTRTPLKKNRVSKRFRALRDEAFRAFVREHRCVVGQDCGGTIECAHLRTRGAGGGDRGNCFAACTRHHRIQHAIGIVSFARVYALDLPKIAAGLLADYEANR